ncbi:MAG: sulfite exporter TauE/SafE family protein [Thermoplasmatota archaeon]
MDYLITTLALFVLLAFIMEMIDSSLGMMYGTLLSPLLIGAGIDPLLAVPSILLSQAVGGLGGTLSHHRFRNADFNGLTRDTKVVLAMVIPGLIAVVFGVIVGLSLPKIYVEVYIFVLVLVMSILCMLPLRFKFKWWKHYLLGIVAAFNKALSGGGFGPVTSTGGIIGGLDSRASIATTTFAEVFICFAAFIIYLIFSGKVDILLISTLCIGAMIGGLIGPYIASKVKKGRLRILVGVLGILSSIWLLTNIV